MGLTASISNFHGFSMDFPSPSTSRNGRWTEPAEAEDVEAEAGKRAELELESDGQIENVGRLTYFCIFLSHLLS